MKVPTDFDFTDHHVEQDEELEMVVWAENNGWQTRKMKYIGRNGAPDRFVFGYGVALFFEMKNPKTRNHKGGGLSSGQVEEHKCFADAKLDVVFICYTAAEAIDILKRYM